MEAKQQLDKFIQEEQIRAVLDQRRALSDANDFETEHRIYHEDEALEYLQAGARTRVRSRKQSQRATQPNRSCSVPPL